MKTIISLFLFLILFSQNSFAQWTLTNGLGTANGNILYSLNGDIYAGTDYSAYKTTNNGDSWVQINNGFNAINPKVKNFTYANFKLWCAVEGTGLFFSTNNGNDWIREFGAFFNYPYALAASNQYLVAHSSGSNNIAFTTNNGTNWTLMDQGNAPWCSNISLAINGSTIYAGSNCGGVYFSFLGGNSWTEASGNLSGSARYVNELKCANNKLYIATSGSIYSSSNNGSNWSNLNLSLSSTNILSLCVVSTNIFIGTQNKIYFSSNDGVSWTDITTGLPTNPTINKIAVNSNYLFVILPTGTVYRRLLSTISGFNAITNISSEIPSKYSLSQNYPNPFNPRTNIEFSIPEKSFTKLKVYDINGREVGNLVNENLNAGTYKYDFSAETLPSGTYFYKMETEKFSETKKMILLK